MAPDLLDRFMRYVRIDTQSKVDRERSPSTPGQLDLQRLLVDELQAIGVDDAALDENGYVLRTLPATVPDAPVIGLIAHMDTSPDAPGAGVEPIVHRDYDGGVIELPARRHAARSRRRCPSWRPSVGHDIVTASGDTLLGADDKAGVAEIMAAVAHLAAHPELPRPTLRIAFTPDEEIGEGATLFDIERFGALLRLHDRRLGARRAPGRDVRGRRGDRHRSTASTSIPARRPASSSTRCGSRRRSWPRCRPTGSRPRPHPAARASSTRTSSTGTPGAGRDPADRPRLRRGAAATRTSRCSSARRSEVVEPTPAARAGRRRAPAVPQHAPVPRGGPEVVAAAEEAIRAEGIEPVRNPIRGGTDGSRLSEMGLPTPNIFTGGHEYHSVREWASVQDMAAAAATIVRLAEVWTQVGRSSRRRVSCPGRRARWLRSTARSCSRREATIPVTDEGLMRGDGVFEVIRVYDGRPFALERASDAAGALGRQPAPARSTSRRSAPTRIGCSRRPAPGPDHELLRIVVTRGGRRLLLTEPLPRVARADRLRLDHLRADAGARRRQVALLRGEHARRRLAREQGYDEALLVTPHGRVLEAPTSSIFWVEDGELLTPPLDDHILASITRAIVIEVAGAQRAGLRTLEDLLAADEVFLASTVREVQPVVGDRRP